jgi:hypothetical protein
VGRDRGDETRQRRRRGGALGVNRRGAAGNGGFGGENGGIWGKPAGRRWCRCQGGPGRRIGAPNRMLPHRGRHGSAGSFIGLAHAPARFWGHRCGPFLGSEPKIYARRVLGGILGASVEILLCCKVLIPSNLFFSCSSAPTIH